MSSDAEPSNAGDVDCAGAALLDEVVRVDSCENRLVGLLAGSVPVLAWGLLRPSVLKSSSVGSALAGDFFRPVAVPCGSTGKSPVLREVEFTPKGGTMGATGLEFGIGFWAVNFVDEVPKELSFRKTGAGCVAVDSSGAAGKFWTSAGGLGVSMAWTLMSLVYRSSRRSAIRGRGRFRKGSRIGFAGRFSSSSVISGNGSADSSPDRKTRLVNDLRGISKPPRLDVGVAGIAGFPVRGPLKEGFELEGDLTLFGSAAEISSEASSFFENILEKGFAKAGFLTGSGSVAASSLWLKQLDEEKQNDKQAMAKKFVFKMLFEKHISLSPSEHKSSHKISY